MKRIVIFLMLCFFLLSSCGGKDDEFGFTDMEVSEYLSEIEGLVPLGESVYEIPCGEDVLYVNPDVCFNNINAANSVRYKGIWMKNILCKKDLVLSSFYPIFNDMQFQGDLYLLGDVMFDNFAYTLERYCFKTTPEWYEWIDYDFPYHFSSSPHGKANAYWYNPLSETYEQCIYIKDNGTSTEIYVVYHDVSLIALRYNRYSSYLISEKLYNEIQADFPDITLSTYFRKGTVDEFSKWFMGEYLEEIPGFFADLKENFYYLKFYDVGSIIEDYSTKHEYDPIELLISDLEYLGINFDKITAQIIKITVPHDGTLKDILWELVNRYK